jgi:hypothetical protein
MLQYIRGRNSDAGESNSRVLGVTSLQVTMYNCNRYPGTNQALNSIVFNLIHNRFAFTVNFENLCWFGCISYLKFPKEPGEIVIFTTNILMNCSYNYTQCKIQLKLKKMSSKEFIKVLVLLMK